MLLVVTALSVAAFLAAFEFLGLVPKAREAIATSRSTAAVMGDKSLDDDAKEAAVQKAATALLKGFVGLTLRIVGILLAAYVPIFAADALGLVSEEVVIGFMLRIDVIVITSILVIAVIWGVQRMRRGKT